MREEAIRRHAYELWEAAGRPIGRDEEFWEKGKELAAIEENQLMATKPTRENSEGPWGEPVETGIAIENQGDFPGIADQGDEQPQPPARTQSTSAR
ncbi:MAG TPA: DUF2934 domain-containing protein [Terriglobia bacterium]|nr:DUF2934 domain-containing protein [Terriglobia bacterium]